MITKALDLLRDTFSGASEGAGVVEEAGIETCESI